MNSSADIKAFCGRNGGAVCTSSNAERALEWAFDHGEKVLFLPDQHLGRNTAVLQMGLSLDDCVVVDPHRPDFGVTDQQLRDATMLLWRGHCSVHGRFTAESVADVRRRIPERAGDRPSRVPARGGARRRLRRVDRVHHQDHRRRAGRAPSWAVGTELNLVKRLAQQHPDKTVVFLDKTVCFCATMNRIDLPHLVWAMENLVDGRVVNRIEVDPDTDALGPGRPRPDAGVARPGGGQGLDRVRGPGRPRPGTIG